MKVADDRYAHQTATTVAIAGDSSRSAATISVGPSRVRFMLSRSRAENLKLDVVGIAKDKHGPIGLVGDWGLGQWLFGCIHPGDTVRLEMCLPRLKVGSSGHDEPGVVQPGGGFAEKTAIISAVTMQYKHQFVRIVGEYPADTALVGRVHQEVNSEDIFVPANAGVEVSYSESEVV